MEFEWDENKRQSNLEKHKIDFVAASVILKSTFTIKSVSLYLDERRYLATGKIDDLYVTVVYTIRVDKCRIISARIAREKERIYYEQERKNR